MREQSSLKTAFEQARSTVATWENAQGFDPSEPQWVIGKNMELMLPQLEQRLFPATTTNQPNLSLAVPQPAQLERAGK